MTIQIVPANELTPEEQKLVNLIRAEIEQGKQRARDAMEKEIRQTYWNVGKHIKEDLLKHAERADYGDNLYKMLADNSVISRTDLYCSVQLYEEYPQIVHSNGQLTWSHLKNLLTIPDKQERKALEDKIIKENLSVQNLKELIKSKKTLFLTAPVKQILVVERTKPYVYQSKQIDGREMVDLGFNFCIASSARKTKGAPRINLGAVPHYTYKANVLEVLDGDTIWVDVELGFNTWTTQKLRFRGINSAEVITAEGKIAKDYAIARLSACKFIAIKTYWRDKYTRYLADVFYDKDEIDLTKLIVKGKFLNQELLDEGYAVWYE